MYLFACWCAGRKSIGGGDETPGRWQAASGRPEHLPIVWHTVAASKSPWRIDDTAAVRAAPTVVIYWSMTASIRCSMKSASSTHDPSPEARRRCAYSS